MKTFNKPVALLGLSLALGAGFVYVQKVQAAPRTDKIAICHGTASEKNPYVLIHVDLNAVNGHFDGTAPGHGKNNYPDILAKNDSCPTTPPPPTPPNNS